MLESVNNFKKLKGKIVINEGETKMKVYYQMPYEFNESIARKIIKVI